MAKEARFEGKGAPESQSLIVPSSDPETIFVQSGENAIELMGLLCAFVFSLSSPSAPAIRASKRQFWPRRGDLRARGAPESHILIVPSTDPDTILVPSGENATDLISRLCASLSASSLSARQFNKRQFWPRRGDFEGSRRT